MKTLEVKKVSASTPSAAEIPTLMQTHKVPYHRMECVNWEAQFPYCPEVSFALACTDNEMLLHYRVREQSVRATARQDQDAVWEDSCVEFFSCPAGDGVYYNIECNCAGQLLIAAGESRHDRVPAPVHSLQAVDRWASLGREPFDTREEMTTWEVALCIPWTTYFKHHITSMQGKSMQGNFYKCGDLLPVPHFVTWNEICTDQPDYHRPEFFGNIDFKKTAK